VIRLGELKKRNNYKDREFK